jgi:hypothetical protein
VIYQPTLKHRALIPAWVDLKAHRNAIKDAIWQREQAIKELRRASHDAIKDRSEEQLFALRGRYELINEAYAAEMLYLSHGGYVYW